MLVAVAAELFQFQPGRCVTAVLSGGVTGDPRRSLVGIGATLGTFQGDNLTDALSHGFLQADLNANIHYFIKRRLCAKSFLILRSRE